MAMLNQTPISDAERGQQNQPFRNELDRAMRGGESENRFRRPNGEPFSGEVGRGGRSASESWFMPTNPIA
jgi:hypothetical protein